MSRRPPATRILCGSWLACALAAWPLTAASAARASSGPTGSTVVMWGEDPGANFLPMPSGLTDVKAISAGLWRNALALKSDGTVVAWGEDNRRNTEVPGRLSGVVAIAAGAHFSLALTAEGKVVDWGDSPLPLGLSGITAIAAGRDEALALKTDGTVVVSGPGFVRANPSDVVAISAGGQSLALKRDGTVVVLVGDPKSLPAGLSDVVAISAGAYHSLALKSDGTVVAWGFDTDGETRVPVGLSGVKAIAAGANFSLALKGDGTVVGWGSNFDGEISPPRGLSGVTAIAAGGFSLALVGPGGNTGNDFPWWVVLAVALPPVLLILAVLVWRRSRKLREAFTGPVGRRAWPTSIALMLALLATPLVAVSFEATDAIGNRAPAGALGQWSAALGGTLISALVAGTIGGPLVRRVFVLGASATFLLALLVAIPACVAVPLALHQDVGIGWMCLSSCSPLVGTSDFAAVVQKDLYYFWFAPFVEPVPVLTLAVGVVVWTVIVRRLPKAQVSSAGCELRPIRH